MSKANITKPTAEEQLSYVNARVADVMELLQCSVTMIRQSYSIMSELQYEVEEVYLSLEDMAENNPEAKE